MSVSAVSRLGTAILRGVFPPICPISGVETDSHLALGPEAWAELGFLSGARCRGCGREIPGAAAAPDLSCDLCQALPRAWDRGAAAFRYEGTGRRLILALKHGDRLNLAPLIAGWMRGAGADLVAEADLIAPVPLHWRRLVARRCNQSAELARALAARAGRRDAFAPLLLRRIRATPSQDGRDRAARIANLTGAIALGPGAGARLAGRRVLLIDDVLTTGATLDACARVLRAGGAEGIDVLVAALVNFDSRPYLGPDPEREAEPDEAD